jgi:nicotinamide-nucleotide amidase
LVSAGTELAEGVILNTHFRYLGSNLTSLGFSVIKGVQIPDDAALFEGELRQAVAQGDLVIVTGGLGPTSDDLTREIVSAAAGVPLEFHEELWHEMERRFSAGGRRLAAANRRQVQIPAGFEVLPNPHGTAPGFWGRIGDTQLAALPGPPRELEPMFVDQVLPRLAAGGAASPAEDSASSATVLMVPESVLEQTLRDLRGATPETSAVRWGTRVAEDRIDLTLRAGEPEARAVLLEGLRRELGELLVRPGLASPAQGLFRTMLGKGLRLSFAESCTGGLLSKLLTDLPGSSRVFWGAVVAYDNAAKVRLLDVDPELLERHGAVSREVAEAMTAGLLARSATDVGVAVTGIAGPEGGGPDKPVGTVWISGRRAGGREHSAGFHFSVGRDLVRRRSAVAALLLAECLASGADPAPLESLPW